MGKAASMGRTERGLVPSPACRRQGGGSQASRGARPSAPSVSRCPTSIPQPLSLILPLLHMGQRQKQSRDNLSVPPAEPRPYSRNGSRRTTVGHRPCLAMGAVGVSLRVPTPHGSGGFASTSSPAHPLAALGCHVWWDSSTGGHQRTLHRPPTGVPPWGATAQCRGSRDMQRVPRDDSGSLQASGSAQQKLCPELAWDVPGEEI